MALWRGGKARIWLLGGILVASAVLALGNNGFVFLWVKRALPFLGLFRYPVKFVILAVVAMPLLGAYAISYYEKRADRSVFRRAEIFVLGAILVLIGFLLWMTKHRPMDGTSWPATAVNGLERAGFLALTVAALFVFVTRPAWRGWSIVPLLVICWGDVMTHMPWQNPTLDPSVYQPGLGQMSDQLNPVPDISESRLTMSPYAARQLYFNPSSNVRTNYILDRVVFFDDCNLLDKLPKVDGFFSLNLRDSDKVLWLLDSRRGRELDTLEDFLSVSETIAPGKVFDWVPRTNYIPIVSVGQKPIFADEETTFKAISEGTGDFRASVYLPLEAQSNVKAGRAPGARIVGRDFTDSRQTIDVETPAPAMLVLAEAHYHNWTAQVDSQPARLWRANYAFEAVEVPAGRHKVLLLYKDEAFVAGGMISVFSLLFCASGWALVRNQSN
jgi:hypothetical protein